MKGMTSAVKKLKSEIERQRAKQRPKTSGNLGKVIGNNMYEMQKHLDDSKYKGKFMSWDYKKVFDKPVVDNTGAQPKHQ